MKYTTRRHMTQSVFLCVKPQLQRKHVRYEARPVGLVGWWVGVARNNETVLDRAIESADRRLDRELGW